MRAFILAGGLGTRLRSVVNDRPKSMALIAGRPLLEYQICWLRDAGITEIVLCTGYLHEQVEAHFGDGHQWRVTIAYSVEPEPLGTAGALKWAERFAVETILGLNGDGLVRVDYRRLIDAHRSWNAEATIACREMPDTSRYGLVLTDRCGRITGFREKSASSGRGCVNAGVYVLEPSVIQAIPAGRSVSMEREVFPDLITQGRPCRTFTDNVEFLDIGTPEGYDRAQREVQRYSSP